MRVILPLKRISGALSESELIKEIKNVHLLGIRSKSKITNEVLNHAHKAAGNRLLLYWSKPG